jgi:hypothetical protein
MRRRAHLLARAKAFIAQRTQNALDLAGRFLASLYETPRDRVRRWWRSLAAHEEWRRKAAHRHNVRGGRPTEFQQPFLQNA